MNELVLHIPHSSIKLPKDFYKTNNNKEIVLTKEKIDLFNIEMCDNYTNELFGKNYYKRLIAPYSRIFCDTEKFLDDDKEEYSKYGMGAIYTKTNKGETFLKHSTEYKKDIIDSYYKPLHSRLDKIVSSLINKNKQVILIDCHSFSQKTILDKSKLENLPDIIIGFNDIYYDKHMIDYVATYFKNLGYNVSLNYPYNGAMIPDCYLDNESKNLYCFMIEINKKLYLDEKYNKNCNFIIIQKQINNLFKKIKEFNFNS